ncbi:MAG TPA: hypothetical protein VMU95_41150 [Trebonia sp.]|nr:hypothetical protein [Trebonia sp.]
MHERLVRVTKVRSGMSGPEFAFHCLMMLSTCGLWYPVYRVRRQQAGRVISTWRY